MISRTAILQFVSMPASVLAGLCWRFARRAQAGRKRRLRLLKMGLRLTDASEAFHQEVLKLKHYRVLRPNTLKRNAGFYSLNKREFAAIYKGAPE